MTENGGSTGIIHNFKYMISNYGWQSLYAGAGASLLAGLIDWFCLNISDSFLRAVLLEDFEDENDQQQPGPQDPQQQQPQPPPQGAPQQQ